MLKVTISAQGIDIVSRRLVALEERAQNLQPVWPDVVRIFRTITKRAFQSEGSSTGAPWKPLAPSTQADRARKGFPPAHPILARTHALERALTIGEGAYVATDPTSMTYRLGAAVGYFKYHQSPRARTKLPRRAPVLLTTPDREALFGPIRLYLRGGLAGGAP